MSKSNGTNYLFFIKQLAVLTVLFFTASINTGQAFANEKTIFVKFNYKGRTYSIRGQKLKANTYIYNVGAPRKIHITTLEWPPYVSSEICDQGWVQQLTIALLASQGFEIISTFYPWARSVATAENGKADILYPEYYIEKSAPSDAVKATRRRDNLELSERIPGGRIAFLKRKETPDKYKGNFYNLSGERIGVVRGYQNTPEFDSLMDKDFFHIDKAVDDFSNARKLIGKRVNYIIGDPTVIRYSIQSSSLGQKTKTQILENLETVLPHIQYNYLYYAVSKKKPGWESTLETLNRTIAEFESSGEICRIISETNKKCGYIMDSLVPYQCQCD